MMRLSVASIIYSRCIEFSSGPNLSGSTVGKLYIEHSSAFIVGAFVYQGDAVMARFSVL